MTASEEKKMRRKEKRQEFSKFLLCQESVLIWIITISFIILAFVCVDNNFFGELPWLTAMVGLPWAAYAVSQTFYYKKAERENTKNGIKYETTMANLNAELENRNGEECKEEENDEEAVG